MTDAVPTTVEPVGHQLRTGLVIGALGVVFGDIGTSPIYTLQTVFDPGDPHPVSINPDNIYGIVSLVFWSVMIIVTVTYVLLVMRADNHGEGGVMALITLISPLSGARRTTTVRALVTIGILGAALFFGDSMITPRSRCSRPSKASRWSAPAWPAGWFPSPRSSSSACSPCSAGALRW